MRQRRRRARQSLAIRCSGPCAGQWRDYATGEYGDALDLVAAVRFGGDLGQAMDWARSWLRADSPAQVCAAATRVIEWPDKSERERQVRFRASAIRLFERASPDIRGTPVESYLAARGIDLRALGRVPAALRFCGDCWCGEVRRGLPAMLAAITDPGGGHIATHRTWLCRDGSGVWRKARLQAPKKTYGRCAGGFVPLWRGTAHCPLRDAAPGETVVIAEGIETALSIVVAVPELRVLATGSLAGLKLIELPPAVTRVIIAGDRDDGEPQQRQLLAARDRLLTRGLAVDVVLPDVGKDFNDMLLAGAQP